MNIFAVNDDLYRSSRPWPGIQPKKLLFIDLDDTLVKKAAAVFKYNTNSIYWSKYRVNIVTNQKYYTAGNKTFNSVNDKLLVASSLDCKLDVFIARGDRAKYRKPSTEIAEIVIAEIVNENHQLIMTTLVGYPELAKELIEYGRCEVNADEKLQKLFALCKVEIVPKYTNIWEKKFGYTSILFVGDQYDEVTTYGNVDILFCKNFNLIKKFLEKTYKYDIPSADFKPPEEFFLKEKLQIVFDPVLYPFEFFANFRNYYGDLVKSKHHEILYITGFPKSGKTTLAKYIRKIWGYSYQCTEPVSIKLRKSIKEEILDKSYVIDMNNSNFKYYIPGATRVINIRFCADTESRDALINHLVQAQMRLTNEKIVSKKAIAQMIKNENSRGFLENAVYISVDYFPIQLCPLTNIEIANNVSRPVLTEEQIIKFKQFY